MIMYNTGLSSFTFRILAFAMLVVSLQGETITVRLIGGRANHEGNLYVKLDSDPNWGLICDDDWDIKAGNVVCRQLGFKKVRKVTSYNAFKSPHNYSVVLDDVKCGGFEASVLDCKHRGWKQSNCHAGEAAGVICDAGDATTTAVTTTAVTTTAPTSAEQTDSFAGVWGQELSDAEYLNVDQVALPAGADNSPYFSRMMQDERARPDHVDIPINHVNGVVEDQGTVPQVPQAIQRDTQREQTHEMLDRNRRLLAQHRESLTAATGGGSSAGSYAALEGRSGTIEFEEKNSSSSTSKPISEEETVKVEKLIQEMFEDSKDMKLHKPAKPVKLELVGGRSKGEGYVRVHLDNGNVGAICSDNWGIFEAMVVCRQLGLQYADRATVTDFFRGQHEDKVIYEVDCYGQEKNLADCTYKSANRDGSKCSKPGSVAGVICTPVLPDLVPNISSIVTSVSIQDRYMGHLTCAMEENCLSSTAYDMQKNYKNRWQHFSRRLLRFSSNIKNNGTADFRPQQHRSSWQWHACHMHYHSMDTFSQYDILDSHGNKVAEGHKASFCLEDVECDFPHKKKYSCRGFGEQGISVGCADVYKFDVDCQWIDITDLKPGAYVFKLNVNPNYVVPELSFDNNAAICELQYTGYSVKLTNCVLGRG